MENLTLILLLNTGVFFIGFPLLLYFQRRLKKVKTLREDIISFCSNIEDFESRFNWFENEIPSFEKMLCSFKPLNKFIVGKHSEEFKNFLKNKQ